MSDRPPRPSLESLPPPPVGKSGWPWTIESAEVAEDACPRGQWPRISIVTPNYNYGSFLEETLRSVLLQRYPNLELIVIDGQSKDNSIEVIRKYEPWISRWVSEPDRGQADAINKGFSWVTGDVCNWLNSDDLLMPGALRVIGETFALSDLDWLSGGRLLKGQSGVLAELQAPWVTQWPRYLIDVPDFPQETTFFSKRVWNLVGGIDQSYDCVFDVDFFHRMLRASQKGAFTRCALGAMNAHAAQKTLTSPKGAVEYKRLEARMFAGPARYTIRRLTYSRFWGLLDAGLRVTMRARGRGYQLAVVDPLSGRVKLQPWQGS
jgi:glycosyltransferase involved in cell wall biosynthesis